MTIDEAIKQEQNRVDESIKWAETHCVTQDFFANIDYHEQIAEWLEELKSLKSLETGAFVVVGKTKEEFAEEIRNKAIDDFADALIPRLTDAIYQKDVEGMRNLINDVAEQLKKGDADNE